MTYYKIIRDEKITDVVKNPTFVKQFRRIIVLSEAVDAMGIVSSDGKNIYHILGQAEFTIGNYDTVVVADITEDEYNELAAILDLGGKVDDKDFSVDWETSEPETDPEEEIRNKTLTEAKARKIKMLRDECQQIIFNGIDVTLSNGETKHFSLELEDQMNFITLSGMIASGQKTVPYHASGELCAYYSAEDMELIIATATAYKTYHTTYFNSLRTWVNAMETVADVANVKYGDVIPTEYCSDVLIDLRNANAGES